MLGDQPGPRAGGHADPVVPPHPCRAARRRGCRRATRPRTRLVRRQRERVEGPLVRLGSWLVGSGALRGYRHHERRADQVGGPVPSSSNSLSRCRSAWWRRSRPARADLWPRLQLAVCLREPLRERRVQSSHFGGPGDQRFVGLTSNGTASGVNTPGLSELTPLAVPMTRWAGARRHHRVVHVGLPAHVPK